MVVPAAVILNIHTVVMGGLGLGFWKVALDGSECLARPNLGRRVRSCSFLVKVKGGRTERLVEWTGDVPVRLTMEVAQ